MALKLVSSFSARFSEVLLGYPSWYTKQLVRRLGLSKQTISAYKNGTRKPKTPTIRAIAKELDVSETWLLGYDVPENDVSDLIRSSPEDYNFNEINRLMRADPDTLDEVQRQAVDQKRHEDELEETTMGFFNGYKVRKLNEDEYRFLYNYRKLNDDGKEFIRKTMEMILGNPDYTRKAKNEDKEENESKNEKSEHE